MNIFAIATRDIAHAAIRVPMGSPYAGHRVQVSFEVIPEQRTWYVAVDLHDAEGFDTGRSLGFQSALALNTPLADRHAIATDLARLAADLLAAGRSLHSLEDLLVLIGASVQRARIAATLVAQGGRLKGDALEYDIVRALAETPLT